MKVCKFLNYHNYYDLARYEEKIVENPYLKYVTHDFGWQLLIIFELLLNNYSSDLRPSPLSFIIMIIKIIKNFAHHCRWACVEPTIAAYRAIPICGRAHNSLLMAPFES